MLTGRHWDAGILCRESTIALSLDGFGTIEAISSPSGPLIKEGAANTGALTLLTPDLAGICRREP